jgi:prepilin-type N-terminal cleavage/methylation domain-containing protein
MRNATLIPSCNSARADRDGFTLLEILIVLSLLLAVMVVVVPRTVLWLNDMQIHAAADDVVLALGKTRARAATEGLAHHLEYEVGGSSYRITSDSAIEDSAIDSTGPWTVLTGNAIFMPLDSTGQEDRNRYQKTSRVTFDAEGRTKDLQIRIGQVSRLISIAINPLTGIASRKEDRQ